MKAIQLIGPQKMDLVNSPTPTIDDDHVILKTERISICGSDMVRYREVAPEEEYPFKAGAPCHETIGIIQESRVEGIKTGDRAIVLSPPGNYGGGVEFAHIPANRIIPVSNSGDPSVQLMAQPFGTVMHAFKLIPPVIGQTVAIVGQGPIGLSFTQAASKLGATSIIGVESIDFRRQWALRQGAKAVLHPDEDPVKELRSMTSGELADLVIEASGTPEGINLALELVKFGGNLLAFGITDEQVIPINYSSFTRREIKIIPSRSAASTDPTQSIKEIVTLIEQGWIDLSWMITHQRNVSEVDEAYSMYANQTNDSLKIVMDI
ncbi:MAG: zinc-binding dehydrogenase [SAR202 cluster bacterium]|nr:zinc-binding dehydrogenase [SAR202 cluster bacterium]|tara:strand:- start:5355 stop:6317 length:963 start_codon:yes stop_codon:yes gene_type:complete